MEIWKAIPGFEGLYEASDQGRIRAVSRMMNTQGGLWLKPAAVLRPLANEKGYLLLTLCRHPEKQKRYRVHRLVYLAFVGDVPEGFWIDHKDRDKKNNALSNLRLATTSQNAVNSNISSRNTSGVRGVSWHKSAGKWSASIKVNQKLIRLGLFAEKTDAARAYREAAMKFFGEFVPCDL